MEGMELPSQEKIRSLGDKVTYKYLGILERDTIKQTAMNEKIKKEYLKRRRKLLETNLQSRNLIKGVNTRAVSLVRDMGSFLMVTREYLKQMDWKQENSCRCIGLFIPEMT